MKSGPVDYGVLFLFHKDYFIGDSPIAGQIDCLSAHSVMLPGDIRNEEPDLRTIEDKNSSDHDYGFTFLTIDDMEYNDIISAPTYNHAVILLKRRHPAFKKIVSWKAL